MSPKSDRLRAWLSRTERSQMRPATSSPAFRGNSRCQAGCSNGDEATGQSRIGPITCVTSRSGRTQAGSERAPVPKSWPPSEMRRSASSGSTGATNIAETIRRNASQVGKALHQTWYLQKVKSPDHRLSITRVKPGSGLMVEFPSRIRYPMSAVSPRCDSRLPEGHVTSTSSTTSASPRPK